MMRGLVAQSTGGDSMLIQFFPLILVSGIVYFLLLRPQQKQQKDHDALLLSLRKGDEVVTTGGIVGRIYAVTDKVITLEVAKDVKLKVLKSAVQSRSSGAAAEGEADPSAANKEADDKKEAK